MVKVHQKIASLVFALSAFTIGSISIASADDSAAYNTLLKQTHSVDSAAQSGRWSDAQKNSTMLQNSWTKEKARMHGVAAQNSSQKFDASFKWLLGAIREHDKNQVHTSAVYLEGSLQQMMGKPALPN